jgi:hypothetical protein
MESTAKRISVQAVLALKEALTHVFWAKADLRRFIEMTIEHSSIVGDIDWNGNTKFEGVSQLIDRMIKRQDIFQNDLLKLIEECVSFEDFSHLKKWENSEEKIRKAKEAVDKLRNQTGGYFDMIEQQKKLKRQKRITK